MRRDPAALADREFDLLVVGGGAHGAFAAWDAALRGLRVALVDRGDFASGTSSNSLKVAHGGLRYLQTLDLGRMRASAAERSTLVRLAPHLVHPLAFVVPTRGLGTDGAAAFRVGIALTDLVTWDRNAGLAAGSRIPNGRLLSRAEALALFAAFEPGLSGAALWYDCQIRHPERLLTGVVEAAADAGAVVANYVVVRGALDRDGRVAGASAEDILGGDAFEIRARAILNAAGPWWTDLLPARGGPASPLLARGLNLVIRRRVAECAIGFRSRTPAAQDPVTGGHRYVFLCPWRDCTLLGTSYTVDSGARAPLRLEEIESLLGEFNAACPALDLGLDDVAFFHWGFVPLKSTMERGRPTAPLERPWIVDHAAEGLTGLISVIGPKLTTARRVAEAAVDHVVHRLGIRTGPARTRETPLAPPEAPPSGAGAGRLIELYGPRAARVAALAQSRADWAEPLAPDTGMIGAEVVHAMRHEAAVRLTDLVFRRSDLGTAGRPPVDALTAAARLMATELGWSPAQEREELDLVRAAYAPLPEPAAEPRTATR
ncbi:MAG: glycerol-3-phosphate dehydrogenase/oxidase [Gemmatimonadales bacterium]